MKLQIRRESPTLFTVMSKYVIWFIRGFGSVLVLQPPPLGKFVPKLEAVKTDSDAIAGDWVKVGDAITWALGERQRSISHPSSTHKR